MVRSISGRAVAGRVSNAVSLFNCADSNYHMYLLHCTRVACASLCSSKREAQLDDFYVNLCGARCFDRAWVWRVSNARYSVHSAILCCHCTAYIELESSAPRSARLSFWYVLVDFVCVISYRAGYIGSWHVSNASAAPLLLFRADTCVACTDASRARRSALSKKQGRMLDDFACVISWCGLFRRALGLACLECEEHCLHAVLCCYLHRLNEYESAAAPRSARISVDRFFMSDFVNSRDVGRRVDC